MSCPEKEEMQGREKIVLRQRVRMEREKLLQSRNHVNVCKLTFVKWAFFAEEFY